MTRTYTVSELITKVRLRGHFDESTFVTDEALIDFIDSANAELHDLLVTKWEDYYTKEATFTLTSGEDSYVLPNDFQKLLGVDIKLGGRWVRLFRYENSERTHFQDGLINFRGETYRYRLRENAIKFIPTPNSTDTIRLTYIRHANKITSSSDTVEGFNGWEELIVLFALRRCGSREGTRLTEIDQEIARQVRRIEIAADARDAGEPESLQDYRSRDYWEGYR